MLLLIVLVVCSLVPFSLGQDEQLLLQPIQALHGDVIEEVLQETLSEEGRSVYRELRDNSTTDNSTNVVCSLCVVMYSCFRLFCLLLLLFLFLLPLLSLSLSLSVSLSFSPAASSSSSATDDAASAIAAPVHSPLFPFEAK